MKGTPRITAPMAKPKGPVDPTCTFWPKGQCDSPYRQKDACWKCGQEVIKDLKDQIKALKEWMKTAGIEYTKKEEE